MKKYGGLEDKFVLAQQKLRWAWNILHLNKVAYLRRKDKASYICEIQWQGRSFHTKCQIQYNHRNLLRAKRRRGGDKYLRGGTSCQTGWAYSKMYRVSLQAPQQQCSRIALKPWCLVSFHCQSACFGKLFCHVFLWKSNVRVLVLVSQQSMYWSDRVGPAKEEYQFISFCMQELWLLLVPWWQAVTSVFSQHKLGDVCWRQVSCADLHSWV